MLTDQQWYERYITEWEKQGLHRWLRGKNLPDNAEDTGDVVSIPGSGRSLEKEMATHSSILTWEIPWTEEPGGLQFMDKNKLQ